MFLFVFEGSGVRSWYDFLKFLGCLFRDRFLIVLGSVLEVILEPFWLSNGIGFETFGESALGSIWGWFLGGKVWDPLNFHIQQNWTAITRGWGPY